MEIRVVTWNMAYWSHKAMHEEAWSYLLDKINADFVLVQESKITGFLENDSNFLWHKAGETPGRKDWGNGIYSKKYQLTQETENSIDCWNRDRFNELCIVANTKVNKDTKLTLISLYGRMDKVGTEVYCMTNLHRILSDLTGIFNGHYGKREIILGGDLNASIQCDEQWGGEAHKIFFDRLSDFRLKNCFELKGYKGYVQTHRHHKSTLTWQNDYFFISKSLGKKFKECEILDNNDIRRYSDHNPVIIKLNI